MKYEFLGVFKPPGMALFSGGDSGDTMVRERTFPVTRTMWSKV